MNKYRSNNIDVSDLSTCKEIVNMFGYKMIERLYRNSYKINEDYIFKDYKVNIKLVGKGGQGKVYKVKAIDFTSSSANSEDKNRKRCGYIVIKVTKPSKQEDSELRAISYCKDIVDKHICPNFLYFYGTKSVGDYRIIMSEYANGNLADWIKVNHTYSEWRSFMFQFLMGVICIQTILKAYHSDLKPKNIFYKRVVDSELTFDYEVHVGGSGAVNYIVPTFGYLFVLADFGLIQSLLFEHNKLNDESIKLFIKNNIDLEHVIDLPKRIMVDALDRIYSIDELIKIVSLRSDPYFDGYLKNKRIEINRELAKYPEAVRNKLLYRSVAYYIIEKEYISPSEIPGKLINLPPIEIINQLKGWKGKSIPEILDTFSEYRLKMGVDEGAHAGTIKFQLPSI
jgi:serine/threonine protein kinase